MSRNKELAKNTMILTVGKLCTQFVSFFLLPLYTAILDTNEYGIVDLFTTYVSLLLPIVCWQFDQGIFRFMLGIREDRFKIKELFSSIVVTNILQCLLFTMFFIAFQPYIHSKYKIYLMMSVILNLWASVLMQFARGLGKMMIYSVGSFITATCTVVLNVVFLVIFKMGAHGLFQSTLIATLVNIIFLCCVLKVWKYFDLRLFNKSVVKTVAQYSMPLIPNQISGWVLSASDRSIVSHFLGLAYNGVYAISYKFSSLVATFYGFFNMAWIETSSIHFLDDDRDSYFQEMIQTAIGVFGSICLGIIAIMPFVFPVMIDSKYHQAFNQIPILIIAVLFQIIVGLYSSIYIALMNSAAIAITTVIGAILNVMIHLSLIKFVGLYAASISTLLSYAIVALYRAIDVKKYIKIKIKRDFVLKMIFAFIVVVSGYYYKNMIGNVIALCFTVIFAIYINFNFLKLLFSEILKVLCKRNQ